MMFIEIYAAQYMCIMDLIQDPFERNKEISVSIKQESYLKWWNAKH